MKLIPGLFLSCLLLAFLTGCSGEPPQIRQFHYQINIVQDRTSGQIYEEVTVFIHAEDPDGLGDIEAIYLMADEEEIFWTVSKGQWLEYVYDTQDVWIGSHFTMPDKSPLPRGKYRVMVVDGIGDRAYLDFFIKNNYPPVEDYKKIVFPSLKFTGDTSVEIDTQYDNNILLVRDSQDKVLNYFLATQTVFNRRSLFPNSQMERDAESVYIYVNNGGYGIMSGPFLPE